MLKNLLDALAALLLVNWFIPYLTVSVYVPSEGPLLIVHQGRDAWPEDTKWIYDGAIRRGIHCLAFHGPGQGLALRLQGLAFRPDWEKVITPVVDFALGIPGVDPARLGLMGLSFGGFLAPRAMAFEKRIKICIANPGVLNWGQAIQEHFSSIPGVMPLNRRSPAAFNMAVTALTRVWPTAVRRDERRAAALPECGTRPRWREALRLAG